MKDVRKVKNKKEEERKETSKTDGVHNFTPQIKNLVDITIDYSERQLSHSMYVYEKNNILFTAGN